MIAKYLHLLYKINFKVQQYEIVWYNFSLRIEILMLKLVMKQELEKVPDGNLIRILDCFRAKYAKSVITIWLLKFKRQRKLLGKC